MNKANRTNIVTDDRTHAAAKEIGYGNASLGYKIAVAEYVKQHGIARSTQLNRWSQFLSETFSEIGNEK